jgi:hypothetical protein
LSYVIGVDTLVRLVDPVYTAGSVEMMTQAIAGVVADGSRFVVLPRTFGAANIPAKFEIRIADDQLLTYSMVITALSHHNRKRLLQQPAAAFVGL